ncbi:transporter substrate-binding domain-containing protein [Sodalis sp. RH23]|uniref:transporter substrate-binding domain-containing protein n=1 Tax=unclassified Sodalis (in: enterobacteria) TaxID=2636512 RepID=UPI0039B4691D
MILNKHSDAVRVGVLFSSTGFTSKIERSQMEGTFFAIEEINNNGGINGREIIPIYYDPASSPYRFAVYAEKLIKEDLVNVVFGCYMSSTRKAVMPIIEKWQKLLFYPTPYEGFEFSNNIIYTGASPNQNSFFLADYMASNYGTRVYMVGSNYIYPYESNRIMSDFMTNFPGGAVVSERYVDLNAGREDFHSIVQDIKLTHPDFIFSTVVGRSTQEFYLACHDAGLHPDKIPIASLTTSEAEISEMRTGVSAGHITSAPYFQSIDSKRNKDVLSRFKSSPFYTVEPNMCWEAAYFQVHLFANAMAKSDTDDISQLFPYLLNSEYDAPQGRVKINPHNNHTLLYPKIGKVNKQGQFSIIKEVTQGVDADPYFVNYSPPGVDNDNA